MHSFLAAAIQMNSKTDKGANLDTATRLIEKAAGRGATFVALPELFNCLGSPDQIVEQAEPVPGITSRLMSQLATEHQIILLAGSIAERSPETGKIYNTSLLFAPDGVQLAAYRKIHLFEIDLPGKVRFCEAAMMTPGSEVVVADTPVGRLGQATCYDLRFPELFRQLVNRDAEFVAVPSAFTSSTGPDHWDVLLRARAIENQYFVIAPNQQGRHTVTLSSYGRSMIVDPWGVVLATATDDEGLIVAELDSTVLARTRQRLPALKNRRHHWRKLDKRKAGQI